MPDEPVQTNLPQLRDARIEPSYQPKMQKRPGTMDEWTGFVQRVAAHVDALYRDARILRAKRAEAADTNNGDITRAEAARNFTAVLKRAADHSKELARELLATGMSREHLENHLELSATNHNRRPQLGIALLYSKLMGIEFDEQRTVVEKDAEGNEQSFKKTERRKFCWAMELKSTEVDDFYATLRPLSEQMPALAAKFKSGAVKHH